MICLEEDWYLVLEQRESHLIYILNLAKINPYLEETKIQNLECIK